MPGTVQKYDGMTPLVTGIPQGYNQDVYILNLLTEDDSNGMEKS